VSDVSAPEQPTRVLIVDDHQMFSSSLSVVLEAESDLLVVGTANTLQQALAMVRSTLPDVVLLDQRLPEGDGVAAIGDILAARPQASVVMVTGTATDHALVSAIEAGAAGFVEKTRGVAEVVAAVRSAAAGEALVSPKLLARLLPRLRRGGHAEGPVLTEREREVLQHVAEGLSNAEIGERLSVSVHTVRNHIANISGKLGAHSKLEVLAIALRDGLLP
jgi:DNA-binding NarL/FixJ family response regulator